MGEEMNQQLFYAPIGSDGELRPFCCATEFRVEEFPVTETKHDWGLSSFTASFSARVKRLRLKTYKLPRKKKKRVKMREMNASGIPTKHLRVMLFDRIGFLAVEHGGEEQMFNFTKDDCLIVANTKKNCLVKIIKYFKRR